MSEEDIRQVELSTIAAIYPELLIDENDPHTISIELPVSLTNPLTVLFPAATEGAPPVEGGHGQIPAMATVDSHSLSNLPSLQVRIALPEGYPESKSPKVTVSTSPPWLSEDILRKLEDDVERLWEDIGRDQVIFTYIDDLQQSTENIFDLVNDKGCLEVGPEHKIAILDYDIKAKKTSFGKETFVCGICLDPKKGLVCHRMLDCGHVFCVQCLQDFYNHAIAEGSIDTVLCLEPNCAKEREDAVKGSIKKKKARTFISPSELLQIPLERDIVMRYVNLKHKNEIDSDKNTVYCPRSWCQGAARSKKHRKPEGLEFVEASDEESDMEDGVKDEVSGGPEAKDSRQGLLAICEDCGFAFCARCALSWHGDFQYCVPKDKRGEVTEEDMKSLEYLEKYTTSCPTCGAPCQKTRGCNHMRCFRCREHFCYLCSSWLDPSNPYQHYSVLPSGETTDCTNRLWEMEEGDGADVRIENEGGAAQNANGPGQNGEHREVVEQQFGAGGDVVDEPEEDGPEGAAAAAPRRQLRQAPLPTRELRADRQVLVAREGPLVLRLEGDPLAARGEEAPRPQLGVQVRQPPPRGGRVGPPHNFR